MFDWLLTYTCISDMSELKSWLGISPESWFLLKWLHILYTSENQKRKIW